MYKKGEKVIVIENLKDIYLEEKNRFYEGVSTSIVEEMIDFSGKIVTIRNSSKDSEGNIIYHIEEDPYWWYREDILKPLIKNFKYLKG